MKMFKKIISAVLAICCILATLPTSAFASDKSGTSQTVLYRYHRWVVPENPNKSSLCPYSGGAKYGTTLVLEYSSWGAKYEVANEPYNYFQHVHQGKACSSRGCVDKSCRTDRYKGTDGTFWFYEEHKVVYTDSAKNDSEIEPVELKSLSASDRSVFDKIAVNLLDYGVDLVDSVLDEASDQDRFETVKTILSYRDTLVLLIKSLSSEIEDQDIKKSLVEIVKKVDAGKANSEDLETAAGLLIAAAQSDSKLIGKVIEEGLKRGPRLIMSVLYHGKIPPSIRLVLTVYEASVESFSELGNAVAEYRRVTGGHADSIVNHFLEYQKAYTEWAALTAEAAFRDRANHSLDFLEGIREFDECNDASKKLYLEEISKLNTPVFKLFHPERSDQLDRIVQSIEKLSLNFEASYLAIVQK